MNKYRRDLVDLAFDVMDRDGSGELDVADLIMAYDVTHHPEYKAGKKSKDQILRELLDVFDVGGAKDGKVTREEFKNYYQQISASIESDTYFELMIRNAWHISGGEGQAANSANRRVLVTRPDGRQEVVEIKSDLGLVGKDKDGALSRLKKQGVEAANIEFDGTFDPDSNDRYRQGRTGPASLSNNRQRPSSASAASVGGNRLTQSSNQILSGSRASINSRSIVSLIGDVRKQLIANDASGLVDIQRQFQEYDSDNSGQLNLSEFTECIRNCRILVSADQVQQLFQYFGMLCLLIV